MMFQIRFHGRGGQGVVTAAELLSVAAFAGGLHAQAFPSFGSERTGAPVVSFCRIDTKPIRLREPIMDPDCLIVQDATLIGPVDVFAGLRPDGVVLLNSEGTHVAPSPHGRVLLVPASRIALTHVGRPLPNAALLGGFAAISDLVSLEAVQAAVRERFDARIAEGNAAAAAE